MTEETTVNINGPYFFAKENGLTHRSAVRFDRLFEPQRKTEFVLISQQDYYRECIKWLLLACKDKYLDRTNLTRSQIVMAYNKDQAKLKKINLAITNGGIAYLFDSVIAQGIMQFEVSESNPRFARDIFLAAVA
jgi:hypothetical protein